MFALANKMTGGLDQFRARLLDWTTRSNILRELFVHRWKRLSAWFVLATLVQLALAVRFPIAILVLGPMILGAPHLIASLRHGLGHSPTQIFSDHRSRVFLSTAVWFVVAGARLLNRALPGHFTELAGMMALLVVWFPVIRTSLRSGILIVSAIGALAGSSIIFPFGSFAFIILFHHFVAFFHWIKAARTKPETRVAISALIVFTFVHLLIFGGAFDSMITYSEWMQMPIEALENSFLGWTQDPTHLAQCLVAYAFGQSIHYTLWLKFIPEQQHDAQVPTSFRQSLRLITRDLTGPGLRLALVFLAVLTVISFSVSAYQFRWIYFCVASLHGFYEIFGLFLKTEQVT